LIAINTKARHLYIIVKPDPNGESIGRFEVRCRCLKILAQHGDQTKAVVGRLVVGFILKRRLKAGLCQLRDADF